MAEDDGYKGPAEGDARASRAMVEKSADLPLSYRYQESDRAGGPDAETGVDLLKILRLFNKRKWLIAGVAVTFAVLGLLAAFAQTPLYTATMRLQIDRTAPRILKGGDADTNSTDVDDTSYATELELLKSLNLAERVASLTRVAGDPRSGSNLADQGRAAASEISAGLAVKPIANTRLVDIAYTDRDPARAQRVANAFGEAYVASNLDKRFQANAYAKSFLEDQLQQLKLRLEAAENGLLAFAEKEQILAGSDKTSVAETNFGAANSALGSIIAERIKNEQLWRQVEKSSGIDVPQLLTNKTIDELRARRGQLVAEYQEKSQTFRADYPAMAQLSNKIKEIEHQIGLEVKAVKSSLKAAFDASLSQENEMKHRIEELRGETLDLQKRSIQYNTLKREADTTRTLYESLLQRYKELDVASGVGANNVFIIDKAQIPSAPSSPNRPKIIFLALALGLGAGLAAAFVMEQFDDLIYSPVEAEEASGLALIGVIPRVGPKQNFEEETKNPLSSISEAFRSACTSLQFSTESGVPKSLLITSSMPTEGKSSTALGIARHFAALSLKVLVVDGDMRNPSLHSKTGIDNSIGLSTYLTHNCEPTDAIRRYESGKSYLYIMTSGPLPPNPVELLHGARFASLLSAGGEIFDLIIVDGPPVMGMADALILSNMVRATLFVIASKQGRTGQVRNAIKRLAAARVTPIGLLLTKFDAKSDGYGYDYHYTYRADDGSHGPNEVADAIGKPDDAKNGSRELNDGAAVA
jgi:capsular exopolysaccharide synthesis family protein